MSTPLVRILIVLGALVAAMAVVTAVVFSREGNDNPGTTVAATAIVVTALPAELRGAAAATVAATPPPAATPTAPPATPTPGPTFSVRAPIAANVRGGPGTNFPILTTLTPGQELQTNARNIDATWVRVTGSGVNGWVAADIVEIGGDVRQLSFANPESTPGPAATATPRP